MCIDVITKKKLTSIPWYTHGKIDIRYNTIERQQFLPESIIEHIPDSYSITINIGNFRSSPEAQDR